MKRTRPYSRHGLNALKARVKVRGLAAIDRRTAAGRALLAWRAELVADLGGVEGLSAQELALIDLAVRTRLYVDSLDVWLMEQPSLVLSRRKAVVPVLRERQQLSDSLARLLGQLGLHRRQKAAPSLAEILGELRGGEETKAQTQHAPAARDEGAATSEHSSEAACVEARAASVREAATVDAGTGPAETESSSKCRLQRSILDSATGSEPAP